MAQTYETFWQKRFARRIEELIAAQADVLCSGTATSHAEYKSMAGVIRGLTMAIEAIDDVNTEIRKAEAGEK
jgi:hypothetical protein